MPITQNTRQSFLLRLVEVMDRDRLELVDLGDQCSDLLGKDLERLVTVESVFNGEIERFEQGVRVIDESMGELKGKI